ncbi:putative glycosyltransferase EpsH [Arthrobacter sp. SO5]|uniref:glycosyltransferase family 2 protein n=1 Tax=Arthrobacter sp. SO5 TaxID=1897055 RepID=UPI001E39FA82|nr:glycosyltransferase family 2 protein [Arthrobacter sp. SO5]MCB5272576.1 putative glycosyltransferase EpsH [Arthrobacter sp. SO5]
MTESHHYDLGAMIVADANVDAESVARTAKSLEWSGITPVILSAFALAEPEFETYDKSYFNPASETVSSAANRLIRGLVNEHILIIAAGTVLPSETFGELVAAVCTNPESVVRLVTRVVRPLHALTTADVDDLIVGSAGSRTDSVTTPRSASTAAIVVPRRTLHTLCGFKTSIRDPDVAVSEFLRRCRKFGVQEAWTLPKVGVYTVATRMNSKMTTQEVRLAPEQHDPSFFGDLLGWGSGASDVPLVSIVISTYNRAAYIAECLFSIQSQTVRDFEVIIVDDGSTDNTADVVASFADHRIRYFRRENTGISASRNFGARQARGAFIAVHDDDDLMLPWRLERQLESLEPGDHGSFGVSVHFDHDTGEMHRLVHRLFNIQTALRYGNNPTHPTWLIRADIFKQFKYDESLKSGVDNNVALRMIRSGVRLRHTGENLILRRLHGGQITRSAGEIQQASAKMSQRLLKFTNGAAEDPAKTQASEEWLSGMAADSFEKSVRPYLPDHLVERRVLSEVQESASGDGTPDFSPTNGGVTVMSQTIHQEGVTAARIFPNVMWKDLAALRNAGIDFSAVEGSAGGPIDMAVAAIGDHVTRGRADCAWVGQTPSRPSKSGWASPTNSDIEFTVLDQPSLTEGVRKLLAKDRSSVSGALEPFLIVKSANNLALQLVNAIRNTGESR